MGPYAGHLDEELLDVVDPGPITVLVMLDVDLPTAVVEQDLADSGRRRDAPAGHPVYALVYHGPAVEVRGVDETGGAVDAPAADAGLLEDVLSGL